MNPYLFSDITEIQNFAMTWLWFYNHARPHTANGGKPPLMVN
ncbi:integrase core domain-containing protein [Neisseriaceae bacterium CLB008]